MTAVSKHEVLKVFKQLHQTCKKVFNGDHQTLNAARIKINEEFKKNKHISSPRSIEELVNLANSVEHELKTTVVQAVETKPGVFRLQITPDTETFENVPFDENVTPAQLKKARPVQQKCCKDEG
ncbi:complex III assembly factor LYRM7 isoform X2 [Diaphorina citri]|uniref:Complex III assembly factor LYRM7 n=1 Tax=Diaphorina citri TaxID=121845 RepID=A0A1S3CTT7_DIACI|nr:complex III assembly factor LYRM7 isoform X1 [Diaphorina citri]XP_026676299.1 complex III assembly factor LYRM7 isoform X2 [Diaphorina citri]KAI5704280.1 hypothetical protein M8J75_003666 [Diaphorina citri]KAI5737439.1 hypothetical protein M8J76_013606 [Diaphorina citri]KAI5742930.1 hypothetical protein M8J77_012750 [Diaphorina citri]